MANIIVATAARVRIIVFIVGSLMVSTRYREQSSACAYRSMVGVEAAVSAAFPYASRSAFISGAEGRCL